MLKSIIVTVLRTGATRSSLVKSVIVSCRVSGGSQPSARARMIATPALGAYVREASLRRCTVLNSELPGRLALRRRKYDTTAVEEAVETHS